MNLPSTAPLSLLIENQISYDDNMLLHVDFYVLLKNLKLIFYICKALSYRHVYEAVISILHPL